MTAVEHNTSFKPWAFSTSERISTRTSSIWSSIVRCEYDIRVVIHTVILQSCQYLSYSGIYSCWNKQIAQIKLNIKLMDSLAGMLYIHFFRLNWNRFLIHHTPGHGNECNQQIFCKLDTAQPEYLLNYFRLILRIRLLPGAICSVCRHCQHFDLWTWIVHCFGICSADELCRFCTLSLLRKVGGVDKVIPLRAVVQPPTWPLLLLNGTYFLHI